ncbi:hypothetical protein [Streptomyces sp. NPDC054946]
MRALRRARGTGIRSAGTGTRMRGFAIALARRTVEQWSQPIRLGRYVLEAVTYEQDLVPLLGGSSQRAA